MQATNTRIDNLEIDRAAFNAAFCELGLRWRWDSRTYEALAAHDCIRGPECSQKAASPS